MLHTLNGGHTFPLLTDALRSIGVPEDIIALVPEYLDTEKPRNNALLAGIRPTWYPGGTDTRQRFSKAMREEIYQTDLSHHEKSSDDVIMELRTRWALLSYAIAGVHCSEIGAGWMIVPAEQLFPAFREAFGADGDAKAYAFIVTDCARNANHLWLRKIPVLTPEVCLRAVEFTDSYKAKLVLVLFLLNGCNAPKTGIRGLFSRPDPILHAGLLILKALYQDGSERMKYIELAQAATAVAATLSEEWRITLLNNHAKERCQVAKALLEAPLDPDPAFDLLDTMNADPAAYIDFMAACLPEAWTPEKAGNTFKHFLPTRDKHLKVMAKNAPEAFRQVTLNQKNASLAKYLSELWLEVHPGEPLPDMREFTRQKCITSLSVSNDAYTAEIARYLRGEDSLETFLDVLPKLRHNTEIWHIEGVNYIEGFGKDDFAERCMCFNAMVNPGTSSACVRVPGINPHVFYAKIIDVLLKHGLPMQHILNFAAEFPWDGCEPDDRILSRLRPRADLVAVLDPFKDLSMEARRLAIQILADGGQHEALFRYADDPGKTVRKYLCTCLPAPDDANAGQYRELLSAKKQSKREVAVTMLEKRCPDCLKPDVQAALDKEKNAGLQTRLSVILGQATPETAQALATDDLVSTLIKGSKGKKADFLFDKPFSPVRMTNGEPADEKLLRALAVSYAEQMPPGRSLSADSIARELDAGDLEQFAGEAFARWFGLGAPAKSKWVLYLAAIHGGSSMVTALQHHIRDWAEHARGAIAAEAANALALNGSSPALMAVDSMARKFKNRQVRSAAGNALQAAADGLGITREELADRIVPDLGFDENLCRVFDFGARQFKVYLTPALELEIFEGDKKLKNLPKPGVRDDAARADAAVRDFKDMKKQMKAAFQSQGSRLEYALLCDRKWTAEGWRELFVRKPVMHCFAIGLIWGVYEDGALVQSFRYMEDGSFNTPDEEEYELPDNASIGLVHPLELDEDTRTQWAEQLSDYEIRQPFPQIGRTIYRVTDEEKTQTKLLRFSDRELVAITLLGRMTKVGWDKGTPMDAGRFMEFLRNDVSRQYQNDAGEWIRDGFHAELHFSGMFIDGYDNTEDVQIQHVEFRRLCSDQPLTLGELPARYFSEIVYQLTSVLGAAESTDEEEA